MVDHINVVQILYSVIHPNQSVTFTIRNVTIQAAVRTTTGWWNHVNKKLIHTRRKEQRTFEVSSPLVAVNVYHATMYTVAQRCDNMAEAQR